MYVDTNAALSHKIQGWISKKCFLNIHFSYIYSSVGNYSVIGGHSKTMLTRRGSYIQTVGCPNWKSLGFGVTLPLEIEISKSFQVFIAPQKAYNFILRPVVNFAKMPKSSEDWNFRHFEIPNIQWSALLFYQSMFYVLKSPNSQCFFTT